MGSLSVPGWCFSAALRYADLIWSGVASRSSPRTSYGSMTGGSGSILSSMSDMVVFFPADPSGNVSEYGDRSMSKLRGRDAKRVEVQVGYIHFKIASWSLNLVGAGVLQWPGAGAGAGASPSTDLNVTSYEYAKFIAGKYLLCKFDLDCGRISVHLVPWWTSNRTTIMHTCNMPSA